MCILPGRGKSCSAKWRQAPLVWRKSGPSPVLCWCFNPLRADARLAVVSAASTAVYTMTQNLPEELESFCDSGVLRLHFDTVINRKNGLWIWTQTGHSGFRCGGTWLIQEVILDSVPAATCWGCLKHSTSIKPKVCKRLKYENWNILQINLRV